MAELPAAQHEPARGRGMAGAPAGIRIALGEIQASGGSAVTGTSVSQASRRAAPERTSASSTAASRPCPVTRPTAVDVHTGTRQRAAAASANAA